MNLRHALATLASLALLPAVCCGQTGSREPGWDFGLDVLYQFEKDLDFDGGSVLNVDDDVGLAFSFGYRFTPRLELQFALDWSSVGYRGELQSADIPGRVVTVSGDMETFAPRVGAVYNFRDATLTPYVDGGIGWAFIDTNIPTGQVTVGCWWDPWWGQICTPYAATHSVDSFTYRLGGGVRWDVGEYATLRFSYEKNWFDIDHASSTPGMDQLKFGFAYRY